MCLLYSSIQMRKLSIPRDYDKTGRLCSLCYVKAASIVSVLRILSTRLIPFLLKIPLGFTAINGQHSLFIITSQ